jgi:hypothetical protein
MAKIVFKFEKWRQKLTTETQRTQRKHREKQNEAAQAKKVRAVDLVGHSGEDDDAEERPEWRVGRRASFSIRAIRVSGEKTKGSWGEGGGVLWGESSRRAGKRGFSST